MGWRDGERFKQWWADHMAEEFDETNPVHARLLDAYKQGYNDGWKASKNYDPNWDAD